MPRELPVLGKELAAAEITEIKKDPKNVIGGKAIVGFARIHEAGKEAKTFNILDDGSAVVKDDKNKTVSWDD